MSHKKSTCDAKSLEIRQKEQNEADLLCDALRWAEKNLVWPRKQKNMFGGVFGGEVDRTDLRENRDEK